MISNGNASWQDVLANGIASGKHVAYENSIRITRNYEHWSNIGPTWCAIAATEYGLHRVVSLGLKITAAVPAALAVSVHLPSTARKESYITQNLFSAALWYRYRTRMTGDQVVGCFGTIPMTSTGRTPCSASRKGSHRASSNFLKRIWSMPSTLTRNGDANMVECIGCCASHEGCGYEEPSGAFRRQPADLWFRLAG